MPTKVRTIVMEAEPLRSLGSYVTRELPAEKGWCGRASEVIVISEGNSVGAGSSGA